MKFAPQLIIFDVDGVLVDVRGSFHRSILDTVRHFTGRRMTYADIQQWKRRTGYNDDWKLTTDWVAQLGGVHLACEQASNILTKILEWGRIASYLEQSTRYMFYDRPLGDRYRYAIPPEIADTPLVHGSLPINETFEPCTINDNSLECRSALDEQEKGVRGEAAAILETSSRGTDIFGALALAEQFLEAYPDAGERTLVLLSDMVQSANGMHLGKVEAWTEAEISAHLARSPRMDLSGARVYVVGAGATTLAQMTPAQIQGIERFWTRWFEQMGASVAFYGANLARFPITGTG